jgi:hypothetical protein
MEQPLVITKVIEQYMKMRLEKGHTLELDLNFNTKSQLSMAACAIAYPRENYVGDELDMRDFCCNFLEHWNVEWFLKTMAKPFNERLLIAISLLMGELERNIYIEKQHNDSNRSSSPEHPGSDGAATSL